MYCSCLKEGGKTLKPTKAQLVITGEKKISFFLPFFPQQNETVLFPSHLTEVNFRNADEWQTLYEG